MAGVDEETPSWDRLRNWVEDEGNGDLLHRCLDWIKGKVCCSRWVCFWMMVGCVVVGMVRTPEMAPFVCNVISIGTYSMKGTLTALALRQWDDLCSWLVYWLIFQAYTCWDFLGDTRLWYYPTKTAVIAYFHSPPLFGARYIRHQLIDPMVYKGDRDLVNVMKRANPSLLNSIYNLDKNALDGMTEEQLRNHVHQKRAEFKRRFFDDAPSMSGSAPSSAVGTGDGTETAPGGASQSTTGPQPNQPPQQQG